MKIKKAQQILDKHPCGYCKQIPIFNFWKITKIKKVYYICCGCRDMQRLLPGIKRNIEKWINDQSNKE